MDQILVLRDGLGAGAMPKMASQRGGATLEITTEQHVALPERKNAMKSGFFVDWNGAVRRTEAPGADMTCHVEGTKVAVLDNDQTVTFEATYYTNIDAIMAIAPMADLSLVR